MEVLGWGLAAASSARTHRLSLRQEWTGEKLKPSYGMFNTLVRCMVSSLPTFRARSSSIARHRFATSKTGPASPRPCQEPAGIPERRDD